MQLRKKGPDSKIASLCYDEELLVTGKRGSANKTLKQKYLEKKESAKKSPPKRTKSKNIASRKPVVQEKERFNSSEFVQKVKQFTMVAGFWTIMIFGVVVYVMRLDRKSVV